MNAVSDKPCYLDKSRMWAAYYDLLNMIVPNPKVVLMGEIQELSAISMERSLEKI